MGPPRGGGGVRAPGSAETGDGIARRAAHAAVGLYPGLPAVFTIAVAAQWLAQHYGAPVMLFALLLGMAFRFLNESPACAAGVEFAAKPVLRVGVALLGTRITVGQLAQLGPLPIVVVVAAVATTIALGVLIARSLRLGPAFGVLSGGAVAICGASAALAIASVLPRSPQGERDTIMTVVTVTALSTLAMILYPPAAALLHLDRTATGIFLGGTIHDVAQVVGAGYSVSPQTGDVATYVKLLRVSLLLPVVLLIDLASRRAGGARTTSPRLPLFLVAFAVLVGLNSMGALPGVVVAATTAASRWCLVAAIAALGTKTSFEALSAVGWRPVALMLVETAWIGGLVLAAATTLH